MNRLIGHILLWFNLGCFLLNVVIAINTGHAINWIVALVNLVAAIAMATALDLLD